MRPTRVRDEPVGVGSPTMTVQDILDLAGAIICDCRPPLLPVSLRLKDIGLLPRALPVASASLAAPPKEDSMAIGGASPERVVIPELGVAPPDDSGMDLEDELLNISPLPTFVLPLREPVEALPVSPSLHPEPPVPSQLDPVPSVESWDVPLREVDERPTIDLFPSFFMIRPLPQLRRTYRMIRDSCHRTVRLLWTSTWRRMETYCWGIRRTCPSYRCRCCLFRTPLFRAQCRS